MKQLKGGYDEVWRVVYGQDAEGVTCYDFLEIITIIDLREVALGKEEDWWEFGESVEKAGDALAGMG
jgi:hypothetical protein